MLNTIPKDFWTQERRVFEPCAGKGGFLLDIISRFEEGLKHAIEDGEERYKFIVEECLYWIDINPVNVWICRLLLDPFGKYYLKYHLGDTLQLDIKEKWNIDCFDAVIGNPPYNDASGNKGKGHTLWTEFVKCGVNNWLRKGGYLLYIHPSLWRQVNHELLKLLQSYQMIYLEIHNEKDGMKAFKCNTRYDWYLLQKVKPTNKTIIIGEDSIKNEIYLHEWKVVPNCMFNEINSLMAADDGEKACEIINDRSNYGADKKHVSKVKSKENLYPVVYSVNREHKPRFMWSSLNDNGHFDIPKVIYGCGATGFISDAEGKYGLTQWCSGIVCQPEEHSKLIEVLDGDKFKKIKLALAVSKAEINTKNLRLFKEKFWEYI